MRLALEMPSMRSLPACRYGMISDGETKNESIVPAIASLIGVLL